jgi:hypothetical protein
MSLETSYEVLDMLRDDGVQTFRAKEKSTGRGLELHLFLPFGRPENKTLFDRLKALPLESRRKFLDVGLDGSTPYVVTDPLPAGRGFKGWAEELIAGGQEAPSAFNAAFSSAPPSRDDGVQILQAGQWRTGTPIPDSLVTKPPTAPPARPQAPAPPADTGDFTRMFKAPAFLTPPGTPPVPEKPPPAGEFTGFFQAAGPEPAVPDPMDATFGEFTGLFQAKPQSSPPRPVQPPAPPSVPATPPAEGAGEFTRMFRAEPPSAPVPQQKPAPGGGAEFTKYFENPLKPAPMGTPQPMIEMPPPPPPPAAGRRGGDFTEVFGSPSAPGSGSPGGFSFDSPAPQPPPPGPVFSATPSATGAFSAQPAWSQPQGQPNFQAGPSEYTKMMAAPPGASGPVPSVFAQAANTAPAAAPAAKKSNMVLFIAIGLVVLLVIGIVVFLLMRGQTATLPATK